MTHRARSYNLALIGVAVYAALSERGTMKPLVNCEWSVLGLDMNAARQKYYHSKKRSHCMSFQPCTIV